MRGLPIILLLLPALAFAHEGAHEGSVTEIEREGNRLGYAARVPVPLLAEWLDLDADDDLQIGREDLLGARGRIEGFWRERWTFADGGGTALPLTLEAMEVLPGEVRLRGSLPRPADGRLVVRTTLFPAGESLPHALHVGKLSVILRTPAESDPLPVGGRPARLPWFLAAGGFLAAWILWLGTRRWPSGRPLMLSGCLLALAGGLRGRVEARPVAPRALPRRVPARAVPSCCPPVAPAAPQEASAAPSGEESDVFLVGDDPGEGADPLDRRLEREHPAELAYAAQAGLSRSQMRDWLRIQDEARRGMAALQALPETERAEACRKLTKGTDARLRALFGTGYEAFLRCQH